MIFNVAPQAPLEHTLEYMTDVITAYDGTEARLAIRKNPKQTFSGKCLYDNEAELRQLRADLYLNTVENVFFPLWHERVRTTAAASATDTVQGDFSFSDLAAGETVWLVSKDGQTSETAVIDSKADGQIVLTGNVTGTYPAGSSVYPLEDVVLTDQPSIARYPIRAGEFSFGLKMRRQPSVPGYGGTAFTTYDSLKVLDTRPLMTGATSGETYDRNIEVLETENAIYQDTATPYASVITVKRFRYNTPAQRQNWKKFFSDIVGGREPFWVPTWRADLELDSQPGASTDFDIQSTTYKTTYFDTSAIRDFQFELADGSVIYRRATACVDNGDGTQTITVSSALPATAIDTISFLEKSRLATQQVSFLHFALHGEVKFSTATVQG